MLNISRNPYARLKEKLARAAECDISEENVLFEIKNEIFIAYYEEIPLKDIISAIDDHIISESIRTVLKKHLKLIVEKGVNRYDRGRC
jgi:hypothetical protein